MQLILLQKHALYQKSTIAPLRLFIILDIFNPNEVAERKFFLLEYLYNACNRNDYQYDPEYLNERYLHLLRLSR